MSNWDGHYWIILVNGVDNRKEETPMSLLPTQTNIFKCLNRTKRGRIKNCWKKKRKVDKKVSMCVYKLQFLRKYIKAVCIYFYFFCAFPSLQFPSIRQNYLIYSFILFNIHMEALVLFNVFFYDTTRTLKERV